MNRSSNLKVSHRSHPRLNSSTTDEHSPGRVHESISLNSSGKPTSGKFEQRATIIETSLTRRTSKTIKRTIDVVLSLPFVLLALPPLAILVALAHWKQSPGPLFFRQERCGLRNQPFTILKFRTMNVLPNGDGREGNPEERIFPLGNILRKTKLDEIPQFVNVLAGSMSVVGPRPHHFEDCATFGDAVVDYSHRTITKPGITGLAQYTEYRGDFEWNCTESRVSKDLDYIRNWSLLLDLGLILKTARVIGQKSVMAVLRRTVPGPLKLKPQIRVAAGTEIEPAISVTKDAVVDKRRAA